MSTYFCLTIDPLHIGAGGYRLGRVDNTIVREPGTNIPKIPASSLSGVCRNYAIYSLDGEEKRKAKECATLDTKDKNNCGQCIICQVFGYATGSKNMNHIGRVKFFDGRIVAFPINSLAGPVWTTTNTIISELGMDNIPYPGKEKLVCNFDIPEVNGEKRLNLGWLYFPVEKKDFQLSNSFGQNGPIKHINEKLVLVPEWLFNEIVNSNLEVRTSVSIDFETGAAESKALFTYEAIPRGALFAFDVIVDEFRCNETYTSEKVTTIVNNGMKYFKSLGIGGMNTRGFGRVKVLNLE